MDSIEILIYAVIAVAVVSLAYGSYTDIRKRRVNSLLFAPLLILAAIQNHYVHTPLLFLVLGIIIFFFTFLEPDTYAYGIIGILFLAISFTLALFIGFYWGFQLILISVVYILGFQERLFGMGDIKGIIALMFASPFYSPLVMYSYTGSIDYYLFPTSMALLTDICIFAVLAAGISVARIYRHGVVKVKGQPLAMKYSEGLNMKNPNAYRKKEAGGITFMVYRMPFIVPIALGYILFLFTGFFPALI